MNHYLYNTFQKGIKGDQSLNILRDLILAKGGNTVFFGLKYFYEGKDNLTFIKT